MVSTRTFAQPASWEPHKGFVKTARQRGHPPNGGACQGSEGPRSSRVARNRGWPGRDPKNTGLFFFFFEHRSADAQLRVPQLRIRTPLWSSTELPPY